MKNKRISDKRLMLFISLVFYIIWWIIDGPRLYPDSGSYINAYNVSDIPLYRIFLAVCRMLPFAGSFVYEGYIGLYHASLIQNLLWAYMTYKLAVFTADFFKDKKYAVVSAWCAIIFQFSTAVLNRFFVPHRSLYSNDILTEAIAMPLFILCLIRLFYVVSGEKKSDLVILALDITALLLLRKQLTIIIPIGILILFIYKVLLKPKRKISTFVISLILTAAAYALSIFITVSYNHILYGIPTRAGSSEAFLCNLLYIADENDEEVFKDDEEREKEWFKEIINMQRKRGAMLAEIGKDKSFFARRDHYSESYDVIGYEIVHPVIEKAAKDQGITDINESYLYLRSAEKDLTGILMRRDLTEYVKQAGLNFINALMFSNAKSSPVFLPISMLLYAFYIGFMIICGTRKGIYGEVFIFSFIVIISIFANAALVGLTIFPQGRYMIYCMGLFYTMLTVMGIKIFLNKE